MVDIDAHWSNRHYLRVIRFNLSHSRRHYYYHFLIDQTCLSYLTSGAYLSMQLIYTFLWRIYFLSNLFCMIACTMCVCVYVCLSFVPLFHYLHIQVGMIDLYSYFVLLFAESNLKRGKFNKTKKKAITKQQTQWKKLYDWLVERFSTFSYRLPHIRAYLLTHVNSNDMNACYNLPQL